MLCISEFGIAPPHERCPPRVPSMVNQAAHLTPTRRLAFVLPVTQT